MKFVRTLNATSDLIPFLCNRLIPVFECSHHSKFRCFSAVKLLFLTRQANRQHLYDESIAGIWPSLYRIVAVPRECFRSSSERLPRRRWPSVTTLTPARRTGGGLDGCPALLIANRNTESRTASSLSCACTANRPKPGRGSPCPKVRRGGLSTDAKAP
jgi:hypothetical protein